MDETVTIRKMSVDDVSEIHKLEKAIFPTPWSEQGMRDILQINPASKGIVAETGGKIAGYGFYWIAADELHVANIAVESDFRRKKIGGMLLEEMICDGRRNNAVYAILEVRESNVPAIMMYKKHGFRIIGSRKNYYTDNEENALIMAADIKE